VPERERGIDRDNESETRVSVCEDAPGFRPALRNMSLNSDLPTLGAWQSCVDLPGENDSPN